MAGRYRADKHEPGHQPKFGAGVVVKHNANQRYATDAVTGFLFRELGERAGVPVQEFVVRSDLGKRPSSIYTHTRAHTTRHDTTRLRIRSRRLTAF